jgi:3-hydroxyisobutyrate dehydrogenase-like beta-hydroxyacid dehydrogenase
MKVAVVGTGRMGSALARRLLAQGVEVVVWNRSPERAAPLVAEGATVASGLAALWQGAAAVATFLADDAAVRDVLLRPGGLLESAPEGSLLLEMSTISVRASAQIAAAAAGRGVGYLRCPVSGNPDVLAAGNLSLLVSGDEATLAAARPVLALVGSRVVRVGAGEEARVVKLAINAMLAGTAELLAEVVLLAEASGVSREVFLEAAKVSAIGSPFVHYKQRTLLERDYEATFTLEMLVKDLDLAADLADEGRLSLPVTELVARLAREGCAEGFGGLDLLALLPRLQVANGRAADVEPGEPAG